MKDKLKYGVIMAGGSGTRFWPISTSEHPKQFQDILGVGQTMIQQTYYRIKDIIPHDNIFVITNKEYESIVKEQLPEIPPQNIVGEPMMKNTAACNIFMAEKIHHLNPNASILVLPSDHLILQQKTFEEKINLAFQMVDQHSKLVTIGVHPTRPETGYGYIHYENNPEKEFQKVIKFTEKPSLSVAEKFLETGNYLWNSGMFVWKAKDIISAFEKYLPQMHQKFSLCEFNEKNEANCLEKIYPEVEEISIDKGILEKASNIMVLPAELGWSDLGTWTSVYENANKDEKNNVDNSKNVFTYHSSGNIIHLHNKNKVAVIDGLNDYIIVDTPKALLICPRNHDQKIKDFVIELRERKGKKRFI